MTLKYELTKLYHAHKIVRVCMGSFDRIKKGSAEDLEHLIGDQVVSMKPPIKDYKNYSHGLCKPCMKEYYPEHYDSLYPE